MNQSVVLICPPTAAGLFYGIHLAWQMPGQVRDMVILPPLQPDMLSEYREVSVDEGQAAEMVNLLTHKLGVEPVQNMALCWLSEMEGCGADILSYAALGLEYGRKLDTLQAHPVVRAVLDKARKVAFENHKLSGLLRFRRAGEGYSAVIDPNHNILGMLAPHFVRRMPDCKWMIEDSRRNLFAVYDGELFFTHNPPRQMQEAKQDACEDMWRAYYDTIAIEGRLNARTQRQFMPKRYWKNLVENPYGAVEKHLRKNGLIP